jgi:MFS family permease
MLVEADSAATLALLVPCGALLAFYLGPTFAMVQSLADPGMRAVVAGLLQLVMSLIGLGLGPVAIGVLSDALQTAQGSDSLRLALFIVPAVYLWSAYHYEAAARTIAADLRRATELARVAPAA